MGAYSDDGERQNQPQRWVAAGAVFTLVQGALVLSAAAVGLSVFNCSFDSSTTNANWILVRFYYFSDIHCSKTYVIKGNTYELDGVNNAALRTMIIMCIYIAFSSIWIIGSFLLLASAIKGKHMRPYVGRYLHSPWIIAMVLILLLDAVAAILYLVDLASTSDFKSLRTLLNIKTEFNGPEIEERSMPPIIMALLTSKGVLLWIIDIVIMILLIKQFKKLFVMREDAQIVQAQLANIPEYILPTSLTRNKTLNKNDPPIYGPVSTLPRLVSKDGSVMGVDSEYSTSSRASALQIAARQGFSYERPPSTPISPASAATYSPQAKPQQKFYDAYSQEEPRLWNSQSKSLPRRENNGPNSILRKGNDVFY